MTEKIHFDGKIMATEGGPLKISFPKEYEGQYIVESYHEGLKLIPSPHGGKAAPTNSRGKGVYYRVGNKKCQNLGLKIIKTMPSLQVPMWLNAVTKVIYIPSLKTKISDFIEPDKSDNQVVPTNTLSLPTNSVDWQLVKEMIAELNSYRDQGLKLSLDNGELCGCVHIVQEL